MRQSLMCAHHLISYVAVVASNFRISQQKRVSTYWLWFYLFCVSC